ncbi:DUF932 domain-containing protein [Streptomyces armeniacus]|uniref:DUF932 domain-containing protein n=2 Tax=Streptomyces armeniacus TaxID=83291 RepID=A0A345Y0T5_9ACTN|nr:DUF932 domain-containing protein [Streptomyces armeniacus]
MSARNAELGDLARILQRQHDSKIDMVAPASVLSAHGGTLTVRGLPPVITPSGVMTADGTYRPTAVADEGIAAKLGIPLNYLRRMRTERPDLYDTNINGWLSKDDRRFLLRGFNDGRGNEGVLRAFLSDSYKVIDNFDVLTAALAGVKESGHDVKITGCDLTDRRMIVRVQSEHVKALAPALLKNYRSPFTGESGSELPIVSAGFVLANSEVGAGAFSIVPRIVVQVCDNGMTIGKDALRAVHLGAKLDAGIIRWSGDTETKNLQLITAQARDAVATFLDRSYVETKIAEIEREAARPVTDAVKTVEVVSKKLRFSEELRDSILQQYIRGGQTTAGGVMQAITATAQTLTDADAAYDLEAQALTAMSLAAA